MRFSKFLTLQWSGIFFRMQANGEFVKLIATTN